VLTLVTKTRLFIKSHVMKKNKQQLIKLVFLRIELFFFRAFLALTSKVESVAPWFLNTMSSFWSCCVRCIADLYVLERDTGHTSDKFRERKRDTGLCSLLVVKETTAVFYMRLELLEHLCNRQLV